MSLASTVFGQRTDADDAKTSADATRHTTMAERARILESLCALAAEQVAQHADPVRTLAWQDPISEDTERLLARLRAKYRNRG